MTLTKVPRDLGEAGSRLWQAVMADYRLADHERILLAEVCKQADLAAKLDEVIAEDGVIIKGASGQPKTHPAVSAASAARVSVQRLLAALKLPDLHQPKPGDETRDDCKAVTDRARKAATARWHP